MHFYLKKSIVNKFFKMFLKTFVTPHFFTHGYMTCTVNTANDAEGMSSLFSMRTPHDCCGWWHCTDLTVGV